MAPDAARLCRGRRSAVGQRNAVRIDLGQRVPGSATTGAGLSDLCRCHQPGSKPGRGQQQHPHGRPDAASPLLGRRWRQLHAAGPLGLDRDPGGGGQGPVVECQRAPDGATERRARRRGYRLLGHQVQLRLLAPDHRDPERRPGRQRRHHRRPELDAAVADAATPHLRLRPQHLQCRSGRGAGRHLWRRYRFQHHQSHAGGRHAQLHQLQPGRRRGRPEPHLRRHPHHP